MNSLQYFGLLLFAVILVGSTLVAIDTAVKAASARHYRLIRRLREISEGRR